MSGNIGIDTRNVSVTPISLDVIPDEGSKVIPLAVNWAFLFAGLVNLDSTITTHLNFFRQAQLLRFLRCQSVFVDNSTNGYPVFLTSDETGETIRVNAFTQGMYPLLCGSQPSFIFGMFVPAAPNLGFDQFTGTTRLYFLNTPQKFYEATPTSSPWTYNGSFNYTVPNSVQPMIDTGGAGLGLQQAPPVFKRMKGLLITLTPITAFAAVTPISVNITDGMGLVALWQFPAQVGQIGVTLSFDFGSGAINRLISQPSNFNLVITAIPPSGSWGVRINAFGDDVFIQ
jgi:hypothetical protein